jgi:hypothetical protein
MVGRPGLWLLAAVLLGLSALVVFGMRERKGSADIHPPKVQRVGRGTPGLRSPYPPPVAPFGVDAGSAPEPVR